MKLSLTKAAALDRIKAAGPQGLTLKEIGVRKGSNPVPGLIFGKLVQHVPESDPPRYCAVATTETQASAS